MLSQTKVCHCVTAVCDNPPHWRRDTFLDRALLDRAFLDRAFQLRCRSLKAGLPNPFYPAEELRGAKHLFWIRRLNCVSLVCRLPANSRAGTFKRCRRRISGTYRTFGTYKTKADRIANAFSVCLSWCGSRLRFNK